MRAPSRGRYFAEVLFATVLVSVPGATLEQSCKAGGLCGVRNAARAVSKDCEPAAARVPAVFSKLDWIREAPLDERVFSGPAIAAPEGGSFDDPDAAASLSLTLREIDLDGDGDCDLVGTATSGTSSAGGGRSHLVYWFADPAGAAEMALFDAEGYAPQTLPGARTANVAVRALQLCEKESPGAAICATW